MINRLWQYIRSFFFNAESDAYQETLLDEQATVQPAPEVVKKKYRRRRPSKEQRMMKRARKAIKALNASTDHIALPKGPIQPLKRIGSKGKFYSSNKYRKLSGMPRWKYVK